MERQKVENLAIKKQVRREGSSTSPGMRKDVQTETTEGLRTPAEKRKTSPDLGSPTQKRTKTLVRISGGKTVIKTEKEKEVLIRKRHRDYGEYKRRGGKDAQIFRVLEKAFRKKKG